ncbi:MAG: site-2 protease family protein [Proteobacteria bacterium]|nr:site-2 protease family protein [Pseudomonadota bacterium]
MPVATLLLFSAIDDPQRVRDAIVMLIALVLSIAVHEYGHALVADLLGDDTPRRQGRVTLNPLAHADPIGTLLFPLIGFLGGGVLFGWGKPVMVNPLRFTRRFRMATGHMLVAIAGPAMNVLLALLVTLIYAVLLRLGVLDPASDAAHGIIRLILLNWVLMLFNLLPIPPLDGGTVLAWLIGDRQPRVIGFLQQYGFMLLIVFLMTGLVSYWLMPAYGIALGSVALVHRLLF